MLHTKYQIFDRKLCSITVSKQISQLYLCPFLIILIKYLPTNTIYRYSLYIPTTHTIIPIQTFTANIYIFMRNLRTFIGKMFPPIFFEPQSITSIITYVRIFKFSLCCIHTFIYYCLAGTVRPTHLYTNLVV